MPLNLMLQLTHSRQYCRWPTWKDIQVECQNNLTQNICIHYENNMHIIYIYIVKNRKRLIPVLLILNHCVGEGYPTLLASVSLFQSTGNLCIHAYLRGRDICYLCELADNIMPLWTALTRQRQCLYLRLQSLHSLTENQKKVKY